MSESIPLFRPTFNRSIAIEARPETLTSDAGLLVLRELDVRLGVTDLLVERLTDPRDSSRTEHAFSELLRQALYLQAMGWARQSDVERLRHDPAFRVSTSDRRGQRALSEGKPASQATLSRLHGILSSPDNVAALNAALPELVGRSLRAANGGQPVEVVLDVDSIVLEVHGHQEGSAYNGQYKVQAYHPLVAVLGETGDIVGVWLRPGNVHTAAMVEELLAETIPRIEAHIGPVRLVRFDAGFPSEPLMASLEQRGTPFVARLRKNAVLTRLASLSSLPVLPIPEVQRTLYEELRYKASSWSTERRVAHVRIDEPGELFSRAFFLVTSVPTDELDAGDLLAVYRRRGCAEDAFGQWLHATSPTLSSTNRAKKTWRGEEPTTRAVPVDPFAVNEVNLLLSALAANLLVALRRLVTAQTGTPWRLDRLRDHLLKVGARVVRGARRLRFTIAQSAAEAWGHVTEALEALKPVHSGPLLA